MSIPLPGQIRCPTCHRSTPPAAFCTQCGTAIPASARARPRGMDREELQDRIRTHRPGDAAFRRGSPVGEGPEQGYSPYQPFRPEPEDELVIAGADPAEAGAAHRDNTPPGFDDQPPPPPVAPVPPPPVQPPQPAPWRPAPAPIPAAAPIPAPAPPPAQRAAAASRSTSRGADPGRGSTSRERAAAASRSTMDGTGGAVRPVPARRAIRQSLPPAGRRLGQAQPGAEPSGDRWLCSARRAGHRGRRLRLWHLQWGRGQRIPVADSIRIHKPQHDGAGIVATLGASLAASLGERLRWPARHVPGRLHRAH